MSLNILMMTHLEKLISFNYRSDSCFLFRCDDDRTKIKLVLNRDGHDPVEIIVSKKEIINFLEVIKILLDDAQVAGLKQLKDT